jgi:hypothetical protein
VTNLISRPSGYYLRYVIPKRFKILIPSGEFRISLRTRLLSEAKIKSRLAFSAIEHTLIRIIKMQNVSINTDQVRILVKNHVRKSIGYIEAEHLSSDYFRVIEDVDDEISSNDELILKLKNSIRVGRPQLVNHSVSKLIADANVVAGDELTLQYFKKELTKAHINLIKHQNKLLSGDFELDDESVAEVGISSVCWILSEVWAQYLSHKHMNRGSRLKKDALDNQTAIVELFIEIVGDKDVSLVSLEDVESYLNTLQKIPKRRKVSKLYKNKAIKELLALNLPEEDCLGWKRREASLNVVRNLLDWCANERRKYIPSNPARNDELNVCKGETLSYAIYTDDDLYRIFHHRDYVDAKHKRSWQFWTPLIAVYSGARQTEIAQLLIADIVSVEGVWAFSINDKGEGKKLKNTNAKRLIPIHSALIKLGLLEYVDAVKANDGSRLFPELNLGVKGWGHEISKWFNGDNKNREGFKKRVKLSDDDSLLNDLDGKKVFHSFRKSAITSSMRNSAFPHPKHFQVFGHEKGLLLGQSTPYVKLTIEELKSAIESIDYGINHDALKGQWVRFVSQH